MKHLIKKFYKLFGISIQYYAPVNLRDSQLKAVFDYHKIDLIIDIGANAGQYGCELRHLGYKNKIISIEPLSAAYEELMNISKSDCNWIVAPRCAIGDIDGEISINISQNSVSSSVLKILASHTDAAPESKAISSEIVKIYTLDTFMKPYFKRDDSIFLKIDTQGYEKFVIDGALETMRHIKGLEVELSLVPLYQGQLLFDEMVSMIKQLGFELWGLWPEFANNDSGRILQLNGIFFRKNI
jgi:FkbM family methyltransferase